MIKVSHFLVLLGLMAGLAGCSSTPDPATDADSGQFAGSSSADDGQGLDSSGVDGREAGQLTPLEEQQARNEALRQQRTIYFDYDSSQIQAEYLPVLDAHARLLRDEPGTRIRLEGHTDERGTREYNIALGERRAEAVRRALLLRGATRSQLLVVSYGEERPAVLGASEAAWAKNRRVGLVYQ